MNVNQIVNMVLRMVMRKAVNRGMNAGMKAMQKPRGTSEKPDQPQAPGAKDAHKRMRMARRIGRF